MGRRRALYREGLRPVSSTVERPQTAWDRSTSYDTPRLKLAAIGSLHKAAASSFLFVVMVAVSVKRSMVLFGVRGMAIGAIIRGLSLISVWPAQCIKRRV
jgi:hypothetical protein